MAKKEKKMAKKEKKTYFNVKGWEVANVRVLDFGMFFTLKLPGAAFYNMRVVPAGRKYDAFISMPEEKGKDNKYYKLFNIYFDPDDVKDIIEEVEKLAEKAE